MVDTVYCKQIPLPSSSRTTPYTISVPQRFNKKPNSLMVKDFVKKFRKDLIFLSSRRLDFIEATKLDLVPIVTLYGQNTVFDGTLPENYRDYLNNKGFLEVNSSVFDNLRRRFDASFTLASEEIIKSFFTMCSTLYATPLQSIFMDDLELFFSDSSQFYFDFEFERVINNKEKVVEFLICKEFRALYKTPSRLLTDMKFKGNSLIKEIFSEFPVKMEYKIIQPERCK